MQNSNSLPPVSSDTLHSFNEQQHKKIKHLKKLFPKLVEIWANEWARLKQTSLNWVVYKEPSVHIAKVKKCLGKRTLLDWNDPSDDDMVFKELSASPLGNATDTFEIPPVRLPNTGSEPMQYKAVQSKTTTHSSTLSDLFEKNITCLGELTLGVPKIAALRISVSQAIKKSSSSSHSNADADTHIQEVTYTIPSGQTLEIQYKKQAYQIIGELIQKLFLTGHVVICCHDKVNHTSNDRIPTEQHRKWVIPIHKVFSSLMKFMDNPTFKSSQNGQLVQSVLDLNLLNLRGSQLFIELKDEMTFERIAYHADPRYSPISGLQAPKPQMPAQHTTSSLPVDVAAILSAVTSNANTHSETTNLGITDEQIAHSSKALSDTIQSTGLFSQPAGRSRILAIASAVASEEGSSAKVTNDFRSTSEQSNAPK